MKRAACAAFCLIVTSSAALACGGAPICTVKDPTGTPLNIRQSPSGKVIGTAKNGTKLEFIDHQTINGQKWARVGRYDAASSALDVDSAYVFGPFLKCEKPMASAMPDATVLCTVADPTGSPLNLRTDANGQIVGTVRNGTKLRVNTVKTVDGKPWAMVERMGSDNAVGWVFDANLKCEQDGH